MSSRFQPVAGAVDSALTPNAVGPIEKYRGWFIEAVALMFLFSFVERNLMDHFFKTLAVIVFTVSALCVIFTYSFTRRALSVLWVRNGPALVAAKDRQVQRSRDAVRSREQDVPQS